MKINVKQTAGRVLAVLLSGVMLVSLVSCSDDKDQKPADTGTETKQGETAGEGGTTTGGQQTDKENKETEAAGGTSDKTGKTEADKQQTGKTETGKTETGKTETGKTGTGKSESGTTDTEKGKSSKKTETGKTGGNSFSFEIVDDTMTVEAEDNLDD